MVGTLLLVAALGLVALVCGVVTGVVLRLRAAATTTVPAAPDLGLLETVAVLPSRVAAEHSVRWLAAGRVRSTVAPTAGGWLLLVFPDQAALARGLLHAS